MQDQQFEWVAWYNPGDLLKMGITKIIHVNQYEHESCTFGRGIGWISSFGSVQLQLQYAPEISVLWTIWYRNHWYVL